MARSAKTRTGRVTGQSEPASEAGENGPMSREPVGPVAAEGPDDAGSETVVAEPSGGPAVTVALTGEPARPAGMPDRTVPAPGPVTVRRFGFLPVVLGGVVAAGLGFAAGWQGLLPARGGAETEAALAEQAARIDELAGALSALPPAPDLAPLRAGIEALREDLAPLADRLAALESRLQTVERAPAGDGTLSASAIAAWQRDIAELESALSAQREETAALAQSLAAREADVTALREAMVAQQAEVTRIADEATERLDAAQLTVAGIEQQAAAGAAATLRRAVLANLRTAVDEGRPYGELLDELEAAGVEVPPRLSALAVSGVADLGTLADAFPEAARGALAAARAEGVADDGGSGVMAFLRRKLDVRSVEPRVGGDPDAILSRAEAALREARLTDALAEVITLPEAVRAPMGAWIADAEARIAALSDLQSLAETLPSPAPAN